MSSTQFSIRKLVLLVLFINILYFFSAGITCAGRTRGNENVHIICYGISMLLED